MIWGKITDHPENWDCAWPACKAGRRPVGLEWGTQRSVEGHELVGEGRAGFFRTLQTRV